MTKTDSKEHILRTTFYLLLTKGYDGVSISDIQRETGLSRGLLYHYYGSKEELFRVAGERFLVDLFLIDSTVTERYDLAEMIPYVVRRYREIYANWVDYPDSSKITMANYDFLIYQMIARETRVADRYAAMRGRELAIWTEVAERALQRGEIRSVLTAGQVARHFVTLLDGIWLQAVEEGDSARHIRQTSKVLSDYYELLKV